MYKVSDHGQFCAISLKQNYSAVVLCSNDSKKGLSSYLVSALKEGEGVCRKLKMCEVVVISCSTYGRKWHSQVSFQGTVLESGTNKLKIKIANRS